MDPIAHTLAGATLAQTRLKEWTPLAAVTLMVGANLPDIDVVAGFWGSDASLYHRRGLTHGVVAMVVLPLLLAGAVLLYDRYWRRRQDPTKEPVRAGPLVALSYLGVLSHPALDWLNTYGVRLLMPFDGRWFYGDTLFIVDPWMWLLMGASVVFAGLQTRLRRALWATLGVLTSALVTLVPMVPVGAKIAWWAGVALTAFFGLRGVSPARNTQVAGMLLVAFGLYLGAMKGGNGLAGEAVRAHLVPNFGAPSKVVVGPVPANPLVREVVAVAGGQYHGLRVRLRGEPKVEPIWSPVPAVPPNALVQKALAREEIRGFVNWLRLPHYEVRPLPDGSVEVLLRDLRYVRPDEEGGRGIGFARVVLTAAEVAGAR